MLALKRNFTTTDPWTCVVLSFFVMIITDIVGIVPPYITSLSRYIFLVLSFVWIIAWKTIVIDRMKRLFIIYFFCAVISTVLSPLFSESLFLALLQFLFVNLNVICMPGYVKNRIKNYVIKFIVPFMVVSIVYSITLLEFGKITYINGVAYNYIGDLLFTQRVMGAQDIGVTSFFSNPNSFSMYLILSIVILLSKYKLNKKTIGVLSFLLVGIFLTKSRAGYASVCIISTGIFWFLVKDRMKWLSAIITAILLLALISYNEIIFDMISGINFNGREERWGEAIVSIMEHPTLGLGYSSAKKYIDEAGLFSSYLTILTEVGFVGLSVFLLLICNVIYQMYINGKKYTNIYDSDFGVCFFLTVALLAIGFVENTMMNINAPYIIWLVFISSVFEKKRI